MADLFAGAIIDEQTRSNLETMLELRVVMIVDDAYLGQRIGFDYHRIDRWALGDGNHEKVGRWCQPGGVGNTVPDPKATHGGFTLIPGSDIGAQLGAIPVPLSPTVREDNYYFYARMDDLPFIPAVIVDEREFVVADWSTFQGLEWQWQLQGWGRKWNGGWQISRSSGVRTWDMVKGWTGVQIPIAPLSASVNGQQTIRWRAEHAVGMGTNRCTKLTIGGIDVPFTYSQPPQPSSDTKFTAAVQIDPLMKAMTGKNGCGVTHKTSIWGVW